MKNRVIKFRAWDVDDLRMLSWGSLQKIRYNQDKDSNIFNDEDHIIMQFTGLHDVNGVEIYEGDVLQIDECKYNKVVEWCFEACCFVLRHLPNQPYSENFFMDEFRGVVIGNIYENGDILNDKD